MGDHLGGNGQIVMALVMGIIGVVFAVAVIESRLKRFHPVVPVGGMAGGALISLVAMFWATIYLQPFIPISFLGICVFFVFRAGWLVRMENR